jgi:hypothetical protein
VDEPISLTTQGPCIQTIPANDCGSRDDWAWSWSSDKVSDLNTAGEGALYDFVVFLRLGVCHGKLHLDLVVPANVLPIAVL